MRKHAFMRAHELISIRGFQSEAVIDMATNAYYCLSNREQAADFFEARWRGSGNYQAGESSRDLIIVFSLATGTRRINR